jgi:hypothetical protein
VFCVVLLFKISLHSRRFFLRISTPLIAYCLIISLWTASKHHQNESISSEARALIRPPNLHVIVLYGHDNGGLDAFYRSARMNNINVLNVSFFTMFGERRTYDDGERGTARLHADQFEFMRRLLSNFSDDDVICKINSYDLIITATAVDIVRSFKMTNKQMLISTEMNLWPHFYQQQYDSADPLPPTNSRYANGGGFIGRKKEVLQMLTLSVEQERELLDPLSGYDQGFLHRYFLSSTDDSVGLDYFSRIFQSMMLVSWNDLEVRSGRVYNRVLNSYPAFLHFNGGSYLTPERLPLVAFLDEIQDNIVRSKRFATTISISNRTQSGKVAKQLPG